MSNSHSGFSFLGQPPRKSYHRAEVYQRVASAVRGAQVQIPALPQSSLNCPPIFLSVEEE